MVFLVKLATIIEIPQAEANRLRDAHVGICLACHVPQYDECALSCGECGEDAVYSIDDLEELGKLDTSGIAADGP